jgi:ATP-binding cassette subfamily C exporter for protease/lipase
VSLRLDSKNPLDAILLQYRRVFVSMLVFSAVITLTQVIPTLYSMQLFDRVMQSRNEATLLMLSLIAVGLFVINGVIEWIRQQVLLRVSAGFDRALSARVFDAAFRRNLVESGTSAGQALADLTTLRQFLTGAAMLALLDIPWIPLFLAIAWAFHPWLGAFTTVGAITMAVLAIISDRSTRQALEDANRLSARTQATMNSTLQHAEVIQSMGMLNAFRDRQNSDQEMLLALQVQASERAARFSAVTRFMRAFWQMGSMAIGVLMVLEGQISAGMMAGVGLLFFKAMVPIETAVSCFRQFSAARTSHQRLTQLLSEFPAQKPRMPLPAPTGQLDVRQLSLVPPGSRQTVLSQVSFSLQPGDVLAVIGPSASGKSSLARALVGVWTPASGTVRLEGAELSQWDMQRLGPHLGYLPQDIELFDGTVADNIARFGEIDSDKVIAAATLAGIHEMVLKFPQGYDTRLGAGGLRLSGGQRQRIGLARAIYGMPALVVLDEPNSNLDDEGDASLVRAIGELKAAGSTVVLVTHRPSILRAVDKLLYLKGGVQHMFGPRDQVLKALLPASTPPASDPSMAPAGLGSLQTPPLRVVPGQGKPS